MNSRCLIIVVARQRHSAPSPPWSSPGGRPSQDHEGMRCRMGQDESGEPDRRDEIPRLHQAMHVGYRRRAAPCGASDCSTGNGCAGACRRSGNTRCKARDRLAGPPSHDRPRGAPAAPWWKAGRPPRARSRPARNGRSIGASATSARKRKGCNVALAAALDPPRRPTLNPGGRKLMASWPDLFRPSTPCSLCPSKTWMPATSAGMTLTQRTVSSAEEHFLDMEGVRGSIPLPPTRRRSQTIKYIWR